MRLTKIGNYIRTLLVPFCLSVSPAAVSAAGVYATESVLSDGKWVKVQVSESGIHQLTKSVLASWGFGDISKVKVFGYGGAMVSETLDGNQTDDLPQVPVIRTENKILFYAQGPVSWSESAGKIRYEQNINPYSSYGYYFITDRDDIEAVEPAATGEPAGKDGKLITSFPERLYHEKELVAPGTTGRVILGEDFKYSPVQNFSFKLTDILPGTQPSLKVKFMTYTEGGGSTLAISSGKGAVGTLSISGLSGHYGIGRTSVFLGTAPVSGETLSLIFEYTSAGIVKLANLDYITINYSRRLNLDGKELNFRSFTANCRDSVFSLSGVSDDVQLWDITKAHLPAKVSFAADGVSAYFRQTESGRREYVAFRTSAAYPSPVNAGAVSNQNLHGKETPTMLIITPAAFRTEAERLAELHRTVDGMKVEVVTDQAIYNEFSSGTPDAMAYRKISKMWFDRSAGVPEYSTDKYRYLLLFGRCLFDNRRVSPSGKSVKYPMLLTWESYDSDSESTSFNTDDVFGFLEDGTDVGKSTKKRLNIGIGRIPVKSVEEAKTVVDKIYKYVNTPDMGDWKNQIMVIADDADSGMHMNDSDRAIDNLKNFGAGSYVIDRVYIDAFKAASSGAGHSYPEAREKMLRKFRTGVIYASYLGHANPVSWTHNELLRWPDIENEFYYKHCPLLFTGTCEFTRWDAPDVSGGEALFLNGQGGMIGLITSSRITGISANGDLAAALGRHVFNPLPNGEMPRFGDILRNAKNDPYYNTRVSNSGQVSDVNIEHSMKYALIGDPAMRLKYPKYGVSITRINGTEPTAENMPELQARQTVEMEGHVADADGMALADFNGMLTATVYDAEVSVSTNGNDDNGSDGFVDTYQEHSNRLYIGSDSIRNGRFKIAFRMPTAIVNNYTPGLVSLYAQSDSLGDAAGKNENFYIYGFDDAEMEDTEGPEIRLLALNGESFKNGDCVNETPYLLASFFDESGINLSALDVGHGLTLLLDGKTVITGLEYNYAQDADKVGHVRFQMDEIPEGGHSLTLRVWDVFGNLSEKEITFTVVKGMQPQLFRAYSTANPAKTHADFYVVHDRPDALLAVTVDVYNLLGEAVWTTTTTGRADMYTSMPVTWNLADGSGRRVQRGIYIYRVTVSADGGQESSVTRRIAVAAE